MNKLNPIHEEILRKTTPNPKDRSKIKALAEELRRKVALACKEQDVTAIVRVEGSVAKDTWLKEEPEIDIFMRVPTTIPRKTLGEISLKIAKKATEGAKQIERFAEHPYLEAFIDDVILNIVPCYDVKNGEWISATDRTPYHTDYAKKRLNENLCNEVRLLKKFLQGIGVYGAEIKTGGFSGYLSELLIIHYRSFTETIRAFAGYTQRVAIDIEGYYADKEEELNRLFKEPLVIVDPVDKARNVASAVRTQKLNVLVGAARAYLEKPNAMFFYPPKITALSAEALINKINTQGSSVIFLTLENIEAVADVLWGQLYKTKRALRKLAELNDFKVLRDAVWSDEEKVSVFVFELEQHVLSGVKKHLGPPLKRKKECNNFLSKYTNNQDVVSGPYIENDRWVVELRRSYTSIVELFKEKLRKGGRSIGVADLMSQSFRNKLEIMVNNEVIEVYRGNKEFAKFLTCFLSGRPFWLEIFNAQC